MHEPVESSAAVVAAAAAVAAAASAAGEEHGQVVRNWLGLARSVVAALSLVWCLSVCQRQITPAFQAAETLAWWVLLAMKVHGKDDWEYQTPPMHYRRTLTMKWV